MTITLTAPQARIAGPAARQSSVAGDLPLAELVGAALKVPVVAGGTTRYVNLDYAASAPALRAVADRAAELLPLYSSVHRGAGYASVVCTSAYEAARGEIASFVGARDGDVVVITRNTTDALNLLATAVDGPVVYLDIEHHANLLPWQARQGRVVPARATLGETIAVIRAELACRPAAVLAVTGASNVTGECLPLAELAQVAHRYGARIAVDGAQLVPHRRIDMAAAGLDYLAFSGHKIYAPFGAGVLVGRRDWLDAAPPYLAGGGAVREVRLAGTDWAGLACPARGRHAERRRRCHAGCRLPAGGFAARRRGGGARRCAAAPPQRRPGGDRRRAPAAAVAGRGRPDRRRQLHRRRLARSAGRAIPVR